MDWRSLFNCFINTSSVEYKLVRHYTETHLKVKGYYSRLHDKRPAQQSTSFLKILTGPVLEYDTRSDGASYLIMAFENGIPLKLRGEEIILYAPLIMTGW
jgi:hypothetical protein